MTDIAPASDTASSEPTSNEQALSQESNDDNAITDLRARLRGQYNEDPDQDTLEADGDNAEEQTDEPTSPEEKPLTAAQRARERLDLRKLERENQRLKKELTEKSDLIARATNDPHEAVKLAKLSMRELVQKLHAKELPLDLEVDGKPVDPKEQKLLDLERRLKEFEEREARQVQESTMAEMQAGADTFIERMADDLPFLASADRVWAKRTLVEMALQAEQSDEDVDLDAMARSLDEALSRKVRPLTTSKRSISALLKDESARKLILEELGVTDPKTQAKGNATPTAKKTGTSALSRSLVPPDQRDDTATSPKDGAVTRRKHYEEEDTSFVSDLRKRLSEGSLGTN